MEKIEGYALVTKNGRYLNSDQTGETEVVVLSFSSPDKAQLWSSEKQASFLMLQIIKKNGDMWDFVIDEEDLPVAIVKITKLVHVEPLGNDENE